jgi:GTP-binding protein Era
MAEETNETPKTFHTGYVAIVGEPNVGKSTLVNKLVGMKLSIVTNKPQTTRKNVLGIQTTEQMQMIFLDTPGVLTPHYLLQEKMVGYVKTALESADVILLLVDAGDPNLERLASTAIGDVKDLRKPIVLAINKVDALPDRAVVLPLMKQFMGLGLFKEVIPISALDGVNVDVLMESLAKYLPEGPPFYDPDLISEQPQRFFVSELIREQVLKLYKQEIPYSVEVAVVEFKERPAPAKIFINAEIIVERDTQKGIIIGKKGEALKRLGERARHNIEEFLDQPVFLELFVKVRADWRQSEQRLRGFGY